MRKRKTRNNKNRSLQRIASKALGASVVLLKVEPTGHRRGKQIQAVKIAAGSGFFVAPHLIATNIHCVVGTETTLVEPVNLRVPYPVTDVVAFDDKADLVILQISTEGIPLPLGDSDTLKKGERVYAVRCTGGGVEEKGARGAVTEATVHGIRYSDTHLRLKTVLSPGNSGGPVINRAGEVIGVAVAGSSSPTEASVNNPREFAYAIPSNAVKALLAEVGAAEPFETWRQRPRIRAYDEASRGYLKQKEKQYEAAIKHYTDALQLNPDLAEVYHNRGALQNLLGQTEGAIADWDAALARNPDFTEAYFNRGAAKTTLGDFEGGIVDCSTAIERNPDAAPAYYNRAQARMGLKQYTEGIEDYDKALSIGLSEADAYGAYYNRALAKYLLGLDKAAQGDEAEAIRLYHAAIPDYTKAIQVAPDPSLASRNYNNRGYAKYLIAEYESANGNMEAARELYEAAMDDSEVAIKRDRRNAYAYCTRAVTKIAFEAYDAAIDDFDRAIKLDPGFAHAYYQRGLAKQHIGQHEAAKVDFAKATELDPDIENKP
ncbi:MAG: tetratricopeptide repeat protein [Candidatus Poribacteria bacterium]|nr:tetratricopeptide repeat protein [Candidatus Poribacteria bacterium]